MKPWEKRVTTEIKGIISFPDVPDSSWWKKETETERLEGYAKRLEDAATELLQFLRDHRSRDNYDIDIERVTVEVCRYCGHDPEPDAETGEPWCCGLAQEHWAVEQLEAKGRANR